MHLSLVGIAGRIFRADARGGAADAIVQKGNAGGLAAGYERIRASRAKNEYRGDKKQRAQRGDEQSFFIS